MSSSSVEQIKERLSITDVVGSYVKLEHAGATLKARCPFHNEKTPSFFVSPARQTYHCFGCGAGGDIFSFVEEIEGVDFRGALGILAERAGVTLVREDPARRSERDRLFAALEAATAYFESVLSGQKDAIAYLAGRGVSADIIARWRIGYAPAAWRSLTDTLVRAGHAEQILVRAGLSIAGDRGAYDRFRGRIMFPITDSAGRVIAFSGRMFPESPENKMGKYINSPETELYIKSKILFGFDKAKEHIRRARECVFVEGQMDAIMSVAAGVPHTVAVSGTALSLEHLSQIGRLAERLVFAFDADDAGIAASRRAIGLALGAGIPARVVALQGGKDPADVAAKDPEVWRRAVETAVHPIDFYLSVWAGKRYSVDDLDARITETVLPLIALMKNVREQSVYIGKIADILHIKEDRIWDKIRTAPHLQADSQGARSAGAPGTSSRVRPPKTRRQTVERRLVGVLLWQESRGVAEYAGFREKYERMVGEERATLVKNLPSAITDEMIFEAEAQYGSDADLHAELTLLVRYLHEEVLREELARTMKDLSAAEAAGDADAAARLLAECTRLSGEINAVEPVSKPVAPEPSRPFPE